MDVQVLVRDGAASREFSVSVALAEAILASLSANPETLLELRTALGRYAHRSLVQDMWSCPADAGRGLSGEVGIPGEGDARAAGPSMAHWPSVTHWPSMAHWPNDVLVIDLAARWIGVRGTPTEVPPSHSEDVTYVSTDETRAVVLRYRLDDSWVISQLVEGWESAVMERRAAWGARVLADDRETLYSELPEFLAAEAWSTPKRPATLEVARAIHERWLLTPRPSLNGMTPRLVLVSRRSEVEREISSRAWEWSVLGECPPPLPEGSLALREGGVGMHEWVLYYDLTRRLLELALGNVWPPDVRDQASLAAWLARERDEWLDTPDTQLLHGRTPRNVIDMERRRIPFSVSSEEAIVDHDCPICRMMAEEHQGPVFCHLDGSGMDEGFAFSLYETREEWEQEEAAWSDFLRSEQGGRSLAKLSMERGLWGGQQSLESPGGERPPSLWRNSFFRGEGIRDMAPAQQVGVRQFQLLAYLSELREDVCDSPDLRSLVDQAMTKLENFRQALREQTGWLAETSLDDCEQLIQELARERDELGAKCQEFRQALRLLRQVLDSLPLA